MCYPSLRLKKRLCFQVFRWKRMTKQNLTRISFVVVIVIYHLLYEIWKSHLVLLEDFGPRPVDFVLFISALLLLLNYVWINRIIVVLNTVSLIFHLCFDVIGNCRDEYLSRYLIDCGWFSWNNIWLPWWLVYWFLQILLVAFLIFTKRREKPRLE